MAQPSDAPERASVGVATRTRNLTSGHPALNGQRVKLRASKLSFFYGGFRALNDVSLSIAENKITAMIGMVFQRANPFPMSIYDNVAYGPRLMGWSKAAVHATVEESLRFAGLWKDVAGRLDRAATSMSGGQQQRLCIARCVAVKPEVILMDEPCSALDPISTLRVEELIRELASRYTVVIVTHNMQ